MKKFYGIMFFMLIASIGFSQKYFFNNERNGNMVMQVTGSPRDTALCGYLAHSGQDTVIFGTVGMGMNNGGGMSNIKISGVISNITPSGYFNMIRNFGRGGNRITSIASGCLNVNAHDSTRTHFFNGTILGGISNTGKIAGITLFSQDTTGVSIMIQPSYKGMMANDTNDFMMAILPSMYVYGNIKNLNGWYQSGNFSLINKCKRARTMSSDSIYTYAFDTAGYRYRLRCGTSQIEQSLDKNSFYVGNLYTTEKNGITINRQGLEADGTAIRKMNIYQSFAQMYGSAITGYGSAPAPSSYVEYPDTGRYSGYAGMFAQMFTYSADSLWQSLYGTFALPYNAYNTNAIVNDSIAVYLQVHTNTVASDTTKQAFLEFEYTWENVYDGISTLQHGYLYSNLKVTGVNYRYYNQTVLIGYIKPQGRFNLSQVSYRLSRIVWTNHLNDKFRWTAKANHSGQSLYKDDLQKDLYVNGINFVYNVGNLGMKIGD